MRYLVKIATTIVALIVTSAVAHAQLVAWWQAENNTLDSASANHGTAFGGLSYAASPSGQGFAFNGTTAGINVNDAPALAITDSLTISALVRVDSYPQGGASFTSIISQILFRGDDRLDLDPYYLAIMPEGQVRFHIENEANIRAELHAPIPLGQFVQITATLDDPSGVMRLYFGDEVVAETTTFVRPFASLDSTGGVGIGNHPQINTSVHRQPFNGVIADLKLFNAVVPPGSTGVAAPEPATIALVGMGLLPVSGAVIRRRKA